jgi:hypothetical protein
LELLKELVELFTGLPKPKPVLNKPLVLQLLDIPKLLLFISFEPKTEGMVPPPNNGVLFLILNTP